MDISNVSSLFNSDGIVGLFESALKIIGITMGLKIAVEKIKLLIHKSPIPIEFSPEQLKVTTVFSLVCSFFVAALVLLLTQDMSSFVWYRFLITTTIMWTFSQLLWDIGAGEILNAIPKVIQKAMAKITG